MDERILERLPRLTWNEIKKKVAEKTPFEATSPMGTALIRVKSYEPLMGLAVNAGQRVREELQSKMEIEEEERRHEEDVFVEQFIQNFPVQLIGLDSRYEYDANRKRDQAVYLKPFQSWGKKVWRTPPTKDELAISDQKYDEFHELLDYFVGLLEADGKKAAVIDVRGYNHKRQNLGAAPGALPLFCVGTSLLDRKKYEKSIEAALSELKKAQIPGTEIAVKENSPFKGDGAVAAAIVAGHPGSLVISLEVKKVYLDETHEKADEKTVKQIESAILQAGRKALESL